MAMTFRTLVKETTAKVRDSVKKAPKKDEKLSTFAKKMWDYFSTSDFGCQEKVVAKLLETIIEQIDGSKVELRTKKEEEEKVKFDYPRFSAVVPLSNPNSHSYGLGVPFIVTGKDARDGHAEGGIRVGGDCGNNHGGKWRYATDEEIDAMPDVQFQ